MKSNLNSVVITGNLVRDSQLKTFDNGNGVLNFSIAVNRSFKKGDNWEVYTSFFDVSYFSKGASKLAQYLVKGTAVGVKGYLDQERWEKDGKQFSAVKIKAEEIEFQGGNRKSNSDSQPSENNTTEEQSSFDDFPSDIPF